MWGSVGNMSTFVNVGGRFSRITSMEDSAKELVESVAVTPQEISSPGCPRPDVICRVFPVPISKPDDTFVQIYSMEGLSSGS